MLQILFGSTLFIAASLLFWVQLFISKMVLPVLGGSAAVWNTCMVFFQVALLFGYGYAHLSQRWLGGRREVFLHPALLVLAGIALPVSLGGIAPPASGANPVPWLLETLLVLIGPPFLVLAGTAPMLQAWFSRAGERSSGDPYFLYAASNLGSLIALAAYPTLIEPHLHLARQSRLWTIAYFVLAGLTAACALAIYRRTPTASATRRDAADDPASAPIGGRRLHWILLALAPSSLLLGMTTHLTTDVAAAPLFWVVPLMLYLLSFVLAFQRSVPIPLRITAFLQALLLVCLGMVLLSGRTDEVVPLFGLHLLAFFMTALMCHQALARLRPPPRYLTEFYFLVALGGALGGIFNALLAPVLFNDVIEYPLMLVVACMLRPGMLPRRGRLGAVLGDVAVPAALFAALFLLDRYTEANFYDPDDSLSLIAVIAAALVAFSLRRRPVRFGLGIAALIVVGVVGTAGDDTLLRVRNFYGVLKVTAEGPPPIHMLYNGTTLHGEQSQDPARRLDMLSYYHRAGPIGQLFAAIGGTARTGRVGVVGLGAGTLACYEKPGEHWTFFEINPADIAIAGDPALFTYLADCPGHPDIAIGDARLSLARAPDHSFDLIILDAFNSDAIPIHLITREAVQLYLAKLHDGGLIVFHITNRYLDLGPVVANVAASLDLTARLFSDDQDGDDSSDPALKGKAASDWMVVARGDAAHAAIGRDARWREVRPSPDRSVWTDDYSNLLGAFIR